MTLHVAAAGGYAPSLRVSADEFEDAWGRFDAPGVEQKAVPDADEDALTMAYEAASRALDAAEVAAADLAALSFATTTPPMAEEDLTARLGGMLDVPDSARRSVETGSTAAGVRALRDATEGPGPALVVAADAPRGEPDSEFEHAAGAGAAAFVLAPDGDLRLRDAGECAEPFPGTRFRGDAEEDVDGLGVTTYDRQAFTETVAGAVADVEYDPDDLDAAAVQAPDGRMPYRAADPIGVESDAIHTTVHDLGDTGAASVPLSLASALADGDETVLAVGFGSGAGAVALSFDGGPVPTDLGVDARRDLSYAAYLRRRGEVTGSDPEGGGAYVSVPSWKRTVPQRYRLAAGRCGSCGALNFPPEGACSSCHAPTEYEPVTLDGTGTVEAVSVISQGGAPPEFAERQARAGDYATAIVAFDGPGGDAASAPALVVDAEPGDVSVGDPVTATIRRIYEQEGVIRYGFVVRPT